MEAAGEEVMTQKVGEVIKPVLPDGFVGELLKNVYGLKISTLKSLNSYDDCNYAITVESKYDNPYISELWPHGYLLKVINTMDSKRPKMHEAHNAFMTQLRSRGIPTQKPVLDKQGNVMSNQKVYNSAGEYKEHIVRLMTFLPGRVLLDYPLTPNLLYENGNFVARITEGMKGFENEYLRKFDSKWNLGNVPMLKDYVFVLKPEDRKVVNEVIGAFEEEIDPEKLPKGYIHGDLNELNMLVMPEDETENIPNEKNRYKFTGVIDFQDAMFSCTIYDLAINVAYMMVFTETIDKLDVPGHILAGYLKLLTLSDVERSILKILLAGRLCQSLVYGAHTFYLDPTNDYVLHTAERGWSLLHRLWAEPNDKLQNRWTTIIDGYSS